jgi:hypothetical protein
MVRQADRAIIKVTKVDPGDYMVGGVVKASITVVVQVEQFESSGLELPEHFHQRTREIYNA